MIKIETKLKTNPRRYVFNQRAAPEDGESSRAAAHIAAVGAGHGETEGALAGSGVPHAVAAVAAVRYGHRIAVQAPHSRLEPVAPLLAHVAKLIASLREFKFINITDVFAA